MKKRMSEYLTAKKIVAVIAFLFLSTFIISQTPVAYASPPQTGTELTPFNIFCFSQTETFPANTPFFVQHGWFVPDWTNQTDTPTSVRTDFENPGTNFTLYVDGTMASSVMYYQYNNSSDIMSKEFLTNFPLGMTAGTHTFLGQWFDDQAGLVGTCTEPITFT